MEVPGSWIRTARKFSKENNILQAELMKKDGSYVSAKVSVEADKEYDNDDGQFYAHKKNFTHQTNKYVVFLLMATRPYNHPEKSRRELYVSQIEKWLTTGLDLVVVDSSGETFPEFESPKLRKYAFEMTLEIIKKHNLNPTSSTSLESYSAIYALDRLEEDEEKGNGFEPYIKCTHIVKITGRYFIAEMEKALSELYPDLDAYVQIHRIDEIHFPAYRIFCSS